MFEKVNPSHPDKVADRIAGAIVDLAYSVNKNPKIAVEVLIGHGKCNIIIESDTKLPRTDIVKAVRRITGSDTISVNLNQVSQDEHLADNQTDKVRCGDNGIFKGVKPSAEEKFLTQIAEMIYDKYPSDGKYLITDKTITICQSRAQKSDAAMQEIFAFINRYRPDLRIIFNPLGYWDGGLDADTGATNRKIGSDMGRGATGGGLCLSADTEYIGEDLQWHRMDEYKGGKVGQWNEGMLEFVVPECYVHNENDSFIHIWNDTKLSMRLTPSHQMLIKTSKGNFIKKPALEIAKKLKNNIGNSGSVIHNFNYSNIVKSLYKTEYELRLQIAFCADGTLLPNDRGRIRVKRERKKERLRELFYKSGIDYKETQNDGYSIFWYKPSFYSKSLSKCCKNEDFSIVYDEVFNWDGNVKLKTFRTTHKDDADFIQFVIASQGKCARITVDDRIGEEYDGNYVRKSILYAVREYQSTQTSLRVSKGIPIKVEFEEEKHDSYCFNVPSHNLVVRHNDKIFITGNCGKDLSKADVTLNIMTFLEASRGGEGWNDTVEMTCSIGDETVHGIPYSDYVEAAREYVRQVGGFEKLAEWGLIR